MERAFFIPSLEQFYLTRFGKGSAAVTPEYNVGWYRVNTPLSMAAAMDRGFLMLTMMVYNFRVYQGGARDSIQEKAFTIRKYIILRKR